MAYIEPLAWQILIFLGFAALIASSWLANTLLVSLISGWFQLGKIYGYTGTFWGDMWGNRTIKMHGLDLYESSVKIGIGDEGLYLAVFPMFRHSHKPIVIPWSDITVSKHNNRIYPIK